MAAVTAVATVGVAAWWYLVLVRVPVAGNVIGGGLGGTADLLPVSHPAPVTPGDADMAASGGGAGLDGLRQRVSMVGGRLWAGPAPDGGFTVHAELPAFVPTSDPTVDPAPATITT